MKIYLYSFDKKPNSTKQPTGTGDEYDCVVLDECSVTTPTIKMKRPNDKQFINKNYAFIPHFNRYYFIRNVRFGIGIWYLDCVCDVMATAKTAIGQSTQYVARSASQHDGYINDTSYPTTCDVEYDCVVSSDTIYGGSITPWFIVGIIGGVLPQSAEVVGGVYDGSVVFYALTQEQLHTLMLSLLSNVNQYAVPATDMSEALTKQLINPIQYIHSIKCVPFEPITSQEYVATSFMAGFNMIDIYKYENVPNLP